MAVRVGESPAIWPDALMPVACEKLPGAALHAGVVE